MFGSYFKNVSETKIYFSALFAIYNESINFIFQNEQINLLLKCKFTQKVIAETRYFNSIFLNWSNAKIPFDSLLFSTKQLRIESLLQISVDGHTVDWTIFNLFTEAQPEK